MNTFESELKKIAQRTALSDEERADMRAYLSEYMSYKPIRTKAVQTPRIVDALGAFLRQWGTRHVPATLILALVMSSAGLSFAAEDALPGELLYPVKVSFNEEVQSALIVDEGEQATWQKERVERRLSEVGTLVRSGRFDEKTEAIVTTHLENHAKRAEEALIEVSKSEPLLAAEQTEELEAVFGAHEEALAHLVVAEEERDADEQVSEGTMGQRVKNVAKKVRSVTKRAAQLREEVEGMREVAVVQGDVSDGAGVSAPSQAEQVPEVTERDVERAQKQASEALASLEGVGGLSQGAQGTSTNRLQEVLEEAGKQAEEGNFQTAYRGYRDVVREAERVATLVRVGDELELAIVPDMQGVEPTAESAGEGLAAPADEGVLEDVASVQVATTSKEEVLQKALDLLEELTDEPLGFFASTTVSETASGKMHEAKALLVRAEVAEQENDSEDARMLRERALRLLTEVRTARIQGDGVQGTSTQTSATTTEELHDDDTTVPQLPKLDHVDVTDEFSDGVHTYSGSYFTPTACHVVSASGNVAESFPEQVTLALTVMEPESECDMLLTAQAFSVALQASEGAVVTGVTVNGTPLSFSVATSALSSTTPVPPVADVSGDSTGSSTTEAHGFFRSVLEKTQQMLQTN